ncbi:MAG: 4Fe-4S dicluster domain-containing protein [Desulfobacterales bacterium]|nr:4Fe-4S dicluster domain-containing protein [Desulfobacterales bacterium]
MDMKRRDFLKIAGISTIAGIGAPAALQVLLKGEVPASSFASGGAEEETGHGVAAPVGRRYGFVIDTRVFAKDQGLAQKCINACHRIHNVPDFRNKKDEIKWIWETGYANAFTSKSHNLRSDEVHHRKYMVLCNHCDNPPCVRACPTKATFKRPDGIVAMDYHRCIGCRFCMAACPYGSRSFNWRDPRGKDDKTGRYFIERKHLNKDFPTRMRGVVEKCNLCVERLAKGKMPKCVEEAGNSGAMIFGDLNDPHSEIRKVLASTFTIQRKPELGTKPSIFYIV